MRWRDWYELLAVVHGESQRLENSPSGWTNRGVNWSLGRSICQIIAHELLMSSLRIASTEKVTMR